MKNLESGKSKIQKICDMIRTETLEPTKQEAREIIENARLEAAEIIEKAKNKAKILQEEAHAESKEKKRLLESSLVLSCRQATEMLKQKIEQKLFNQELDDLVKKEMSKPHLIVRLIEGFVHSLEEHGIDEDFDVLIPKDITARSINALLAEKILERLHNRSVELGDFHGGIQIKMKGRQMTIDISDQTVRQLIADYIRRDFLDFLFQG